METCRGVGHAFDVRFVCSNAERTLLTEHHRGDLPGVDARLPVVMPWNRVEISDDVADVIDHYVARERNDKRDENGREPLFTTRQGRASIAKVRGAIYIATQPCIRIACPHGENAKKCEYRKRDHASKCPSSRSPHRIRTGSIQWQLDQGIAPEDVSDRVDASVDTIRRHYDVPGDREKMENRRRKYTGVLEDSIDEDDNDDPDTSSTTSTIQ